MLSSRWRDVLALVLTGVVLLAGAGAYLVRDPESVLWLLLSGVSSFALGIVVLVAGIWWMRGGRAGDGLRGLAVPLACASALPLVVEALAASSTEAARALAVVGPSLASVLLGDAIAAHAPTARRRVVAVGAALACGAVAIILPLVQIAAGRAWGYFEGQDGVAIAGWLALLLTALIPMLIVTATRPLPGTPLAGADNPGPAWLVAAACTPAVGMLSQAGPPVWRVAEDLLVPLWLMALAVGRATARRLAQARLQRDLAVTVTEAERSRLAAELHDVALQELTLLVRRLDATGDAAGAAMARSVSDRLRELCGDLHLPILDELGAGPALDWLVGQIATATGEDVRLERADPARPPAGVELAVFRVAQEAISNAVKHGGPPILVRYTTSPTAASLFVDDAGPGLDVDHRTVAPRPGHYGLASMQQRAEQIGALLAIRAWPGGGTRVSLEWRAP